MSWGHPALATTFDNTIPAPPVPRPPALDDFVTYKSPRTVKELPTFSWTSEQFVYELNWDLVHFVRLESRLYNVRRGSEARELLQATRPVDLVLEQQPTEGSTSRRIFVSSGSTCLGELSELLGQVLEPWLEYFSIDVSVSAVLENDMDSEEDYQTQEQEMADSPQDYYLTVNIFTASDFKTQIPAFTVEKLENFFSRYPVFDHYPPMNTLVDPWYTPSEEEGVSSDAEVDHFLGEMSDADDWALAADEGSCEEDYEDNSLDMEGVQSTPVAPLIAVPPVPARGQIPLKKRPPRTPTIEREIYYQRVEVESKEVSVLLRQAGPQTNAEIPPVEDKPTLAELRATDKESRGDIRALVVDQIVSALMCAALDSNPNPNPARGREPSPDSPSPSPPRSSSPAAPAASTLSADLAASATASATSTRGATLSSYSSRSTSASSDAPPSPLRASSPDVNPNDDLPAPAPAAPVGIDAAAPGIAGMWSRAENTKRYAIDQRISKVLAGFIDEETAKEVASFVFDELMLQPGMVLASARARNQRAPTRADHLQCKIARFDATHVGVYAVVEDFFRQLTKDDSLILYTGKSAAETQYPTPRHTSNSIHMKLFARYLYLTHGINRAVGRFCSGVGHRAFCHLYRLQRTGDAERVKFYNVSFAADADPTAPLYDNTHWVLHLFDGTARLKGYSMPMMVAILEVIAMYLFSPIASTATTLNLATVNKIRSDSAAARGEHHRPFNLYYQAKELNTIPAFVGGSSHSMKEKAHPILEFLQGRDRFHLRNLAFVDTEGSKAPTLLAQNSLSAASRVSVAKTDHAADRNVELCDLLPSDSMAIITQVWVETLARGYLDTTSEDEEDVEDDDVTTLRAAWRQYEDFAHLSLVWSPHRIFKVPDEYSTNLDVAAWVRGPTRLLGKARFHFAHLTNPILFANPSITTPFRPLLPDNVIALLDGAGLVELSAKVDQMQTELNFPSIGLFFTPQAEGLPGVWLTFEERGVAAFDGHNVEQTDIAIPLTESEDVYKQRLESWVLNWIAIMEHYRVQYYKALEMRWTLERLSE